MSRSVFRDLARGDVIVFYRTGGYYKGVVTTLGIVEAVHLSIKNEEHFIRLCRKRSVFTDDELRKQWHYNPNWRPFVVEFLYALHFTKKPNLKELIDNNVIENVDSVPRGFELLTTDQFETVLNLARADARFIVD